MRRWAAAAALHPDARSNRAAGERPPKPVAYRDGNAAANRIRERYPRPIARNGSELGGRAS